MRRAFFLVISGCFATLSLGCGSIGDQSTWVKAQGGLVSDSHQRRAEAACALLGRPVEGRPQVYALNSDSVGAYSWPNGNIFVTRGLVDLLNDQELAAAIAHEMGHLLNDGHLHAVASLRGCCVSPDAEVRADATGMELLRSRGISATSMVTMLQKVRASLPASSSCRDAIKARIELLSSQAGGNVPDQNRTRAAASINRSAGN